MARRFATRTVRDFPLISENEKGERVTEKVDIVYRSYSQKLIEEVEKAETTEENKMVPYGVYLAHQVVRIIIAEGEDKGKDLTGDDDKAVKFYDGSSEESLKAARGFFLPLSIGDVAKPMLEAIEADINPLKPSPEPGQEA